MAPVKFECSNGVGRIIFDRPQALNAIDVATAECLLDHCRKLTSLQGLRVVTLSGTGRSFMAGGDLAAFDQASDPGALACLIIEPLNEALGLLAALPLPVIGSVHGAVSGAGMSIAMGCDLTLAAADARFCLAYIGIGASLDAGASWHLLRQLGLQRAMQLALLNEVLGAEEAQRLGLIAKAVPAPRLEAETAALAMRLANGPSFAYGQIKALLRGAAQRSLDEQMMVEKLAFQACAQTTDFREGIAAFFGKRKAQFTGA